MHKKPTIVFVAGGMATRMKPLTEKIAKTMVDVNGMPFIQHQMEHFRNNGYKDFVFCIAHLAEQVKEHFGDGSKFGVNIKYGGEPKELLGTAGAVKFVENLIESEECIIFYGDSITTLDFDKALKFHRESNSDFTIVVRDITREYMKTRENGAPDSAVIIDDKNKILALLEKPTREDYDPYRNDQNYINSGFYIMPKKIFSLISEHTKCDFAKDLIPKMLSGGMKLFAYISNDWFREIGSIEKYESFKHEVRHKNNALEKHKAVFLDRDGVINKNVKGMNHIDQFELIDEKRFVQAIKKLHDFGYLTIVVTNQPDVAKGISSFDLLDSVHDKMNRALLKHDVKIDWIYICPHSPRKDLENPVPHLNIECDCRKPKAGMLLRAIDEWNIDVSQSYIIGDSKSDIAAGQIAGVKTIFVTLGGGSGSVQEHESKDIIPDFTTHDLLDAVDYIVQHTK